ncbi:SIR2 family protein [Aeromonas veronii]|uniref:SIR2 family protein n=1 Tax=Aeromonas veronii TaxID=654 RepID=UPI00131955CE|nr:SIR2 family protein [Aeromonas veronii]QHC07816.1 SIR2 family protein [Aeromonas veronii]
MTKPCTLSFFSADSKLVDEQEIPLAIEVGKDDEKARLAPFHKFINQLVDAENLIVLAGSGTSLTFNQKEQDNIAPSMGDLWRICSDLDASRFDKVLKAVKYSDVAEKWDDGEQKNDIELLLSLCDSYLTLKCLSSADQECVEAFLKAAKVAILEHTNFVDRVATDGWTAHNTFVGVLGRRSPKQKRLKLFTTNYDLAFEMAASNTGMIVIDGFEFSNPSRFNPAWFHYDIVNRSQATEKGGAYLPNIVHLYKIHGSVDWVRTSQGVQKRSALNTTEGEPVFIYPSSSKYQSSYDSPYLDMMAAFLDALQKPKTALLCVGFGFNDNHINSAITMALRTNPELMVMAATKDPFSVNGSFNSAIRSQLMSVIKAGDSRVAIADCTFDVFASLLPNRHKPTPEESLLKAFELVVQRGGAV